MIGKADEGSVDEARALASQGRTDEAIEFLRRVTAGSSDAAAHNLLGALLNREGRYPEALVHSARAAELEPPNLRYRYNRGIVLAEHGRFKEALEDFNSAIAGTPREAPMYLERGAALLSLGRDEAARDDWATARRLDPKLAWTDWYEGLHDLIDGNSEPARTKLSAVAVAEPSFETAKAWLVLIKAPGRATAKDSWTAAILDFHGGRRTFVALLTEAGKDRTSGDQRRTGEVWLHQGFRLRNAGQTQEAARAFRKATAVQAPRHAWKLLAERELARLSRMR